MEYYVSQAAETSGDGSCEKPFQSIGQAAQLAQAGDEVIISDGIYREWVSPKNSGTPESPIVYRAAEGTKPVISGAEGIKGWVAEKNGVWSVTIGNDFFGDYNPYACEIYGDWYHNGGQTHHTGEVFFDDEAMYEEKDLASLYRETPEKKERVRRWFAVTDERQTKIYARFACENPMEHHIEISVRPF